MRHQIELRRDSKTFLVVDEDCGIPTSLVEPYRSSNDSGPLAQSDPRSCLLSMSEYDKAQSYEVYDYQTATRPEQGQHAYGGFTHPTYANDYVATQAQVPSGLPQSSSTVSLGAAAQPYGTHDPTYYGQQAAQYPAYLEPPRPVPQIVNVSPRAGPTGTQVTVYFQSPYDFDAPQVAPFIMFGSKRCESILTRTPNTGFYEYTLTTTAPSPASTNSPTAQVPLHLILDDTNVAWEGSPSLDVGLFTYQDQPTYYQLDSPQMSAQPQLQPPRKRKLSPESSPRRSPAKKISMHNLGQHQSPIATFRRPSVPDIYQNRQFSQMSDYSSYAQIPSQQYQRSQATPSMQTSQSPSWSYTHGLQTTRSPSDAVLSTASKSSQLLPSPAAGHAPPLIRTSTLQGSPTTPGAHIPATAIASAFNPYAIYPSNAKAMLKIEGDLNSMSDKWTALEWEARRRLVQFRRSQSGSVISATFEPVTLEDRLPNSICVSCIWWEEKQECYVTSVDTISLLESLVAVRFTVEEKNRIRRNLEGFRPATVSKTKADSEEFFKLIMGFPNPKPRNIEKDSASYSSTAGALHPGASGYAAARPSDAGMDQRAAASPRSASSSAASHSHVYAPPPMPNPYSPHAAMQSGLGIGSSAAYSDPRLAVPTSAGAQTTSWHQPSAHYSTDLSGTRQDWSFGVGQYLSASPATGLPGTAQSYPYQQRIPSLTGPAAMPAEARFVPLHDYETHSQPTSTS
ncbi:hypothetical protein AC579_4930 [Pseudocercospora musae]|uniref:DUF7082 domain-containing protein n=1 Tax=Pseudocercospora musae TaxID=113226 RepID=A0A139I233_9PEZI|nr:hypothetical protein AC579_4930 [Pseudocercospora musae]